VIEIHRWMKRSFVAIRLVPFFPWLSPNTGPTRSANRDAPFLTGCEKMTDLTS
jgi:hypothetical protein